MTSKKEFELKSASSTVSADFFSVFGEYFRLKRVASKKSASETASHLGISLDTIQAYESGKLPIPLNLVYALTAFLQIPPAEVEMLIIDPLIGIIRQTPFFEKDAVTIENRGQILQKARETVQLSVTEVVQIISPSYPISEPEFINLEKGESEPSVSFWIQFCHHLDLPMDAAYGYSRTEHLMRINRALENNDLKIPVKPALAKALEAFKIDLEKHLQQLKVIKLNSDRSSDRN